MTWEIGWSWILPTGYKQMKLFLTRLDATDHGIFGHLTCDGDPFNCVTLERHDISIPVGTYKVTLYQSPTKGLVPLLHDVPNREMIEIHWGNYETDSLGCILVGMERDGFAIDSSKSAFQSLMNVLNGCDDISITIK